VSPAFSNQKENLLKNLVYASEDSIIVNHVSDTFDNYNRKINTDNPYKSKPETKITRVVVIGLKTGVIFEYSHLMLLYEGQIFNSANFNLNKTPKYVGSGSQLGFVGPFGSTFGSHLHAIAYASDEGINNKEFIQLKKLIETTEVGYINNASLLAQVRKLGNREPNRYGYKIVDPEPILRNSGYGGAVKGLPTDGAWAVRPKIINLTPNDFETAKSIYESSGYSGITLAKGL
jgi:hypothetical protein